MAKTFESFRLIIVYYLILILLQTKLLKDGFCIF